jgi:hypothetical protein
MTVVAVQLSESLQNLVDSRLDTIDRMLLGRVPRQDRLGIVKEVEAQVFELLGERDADGLSRDDVLAMLARLDPPEAYLSDEMGDEPVPARVRSRVRVTEPVRKEESKVAKLSGIVGLLSIALILLSPLGYLVALPFQSLAVLGIVSGGMLCLAWTMSILAIVLGIGSWKGSAWAIVGIVTGAMSLLFCLAAVILILLVGF